MDNNRVFTRIQLKELCEGFVDPAQKVNFKLEDVPVSLRSLVPYAEIWGVADDWEREGLVQKTPENIRENLKFIISSFEDELDCWLAGDEAVCDPSDAYIAFSALRMAVDFI